jgi:SAM-dependent methyltransferase
MKDPRIKKHPLGYLEAVEKPDSQTLSKYYAERYFQSNQGNYRDNYSEDELKLIHSKIHQRGDVVSRIRGGGTLGRMLDVGCGEGFALAYFRNQGWTVEGLDYSSSGLLAMNPDCMDVLHTGDVMSLLKSRVKCGKRYSLVWLNNVLEHVVDPPSLLKQLLHLMGERGVLVVTVPNDFSALQQYLLEHKKIDHPFWIALPDHLAYFDRASLEATAHSTGWRTAATLADFPIDWFLAHSGSNYVCDSEQGLEAHRARISLENLLAEQPIVSVNKFYEAMAQVGMGRNITTFLVPKASK